MTTTATCSTASSERDPREAMDPARTVNAAEEADQRLVRVGAQGAGRPKTPGRRHQHTELRPGEESRTGASQPPQQSGAGNSDFRRVGAQMDEKAADHAQAPSAIARPPPCAGTGPRHRRLGLMRPIGLPCLHEEKEVAQEALLGPHHETEGTPQSEVLVEPSTQLHRRHHSPPGQGSATP